ncbi:helix-turn-helix domain-containing protein [Aerococcus sanguinicola]|nr:MULTISPECIES: helix-turn-helix transcriptional regulator [Aerococcus]AMB94408.1 hypothetical protein AWM72_06350 [Aerococcus sanguinicola]MDK7051098.1 helix-turn-helix transcriptional regulator [Aerococcus sanguinicola]OFT94078.1 hypothetical protein HMPREF3090_06050 [Aerococcus sp. HMSC23C02]
MTVKDNVPIGNRIRNIRLENGLTTEQFAELFTPPASKGTVSKWENGKYLPNNKRLKTIADLAGITVEELLHNNKYSYETIEQLLSDEEKGIAFLNNQFSKLLTEHINNNFSKVIEKNNFESMDYLNVNRQANNFLKLWAILKNTYRSEVQLTEDDLKGNATHQHSIIYDKKLSEVAYTRLSKEIICLYKENQQVSEPLFYLVNEKNEHLIEIIQYLTNIVIRIFLIDNIGEGIDYLLKRIISSAQLDINNLFEVKDHPVIFQSNIIQKKEDFNNAINYETYKNIQSKLNDIKKYITLNLGSEYDKKQIETQQDN